MKEYLAPDIYIEEVSTGARPIEAVGTSTAAFIGVAPKDGAFRNEARAFNNWSEFLGELWEEGAPTTHLAHAVYGFFQNGGRRCFVVNVGRDAKQIGGKRTVGLGRLESIDEIAIVAAPGYADTASHQALLDHCESMADRVAILDPPAEVPKVEQLTRVAEGKPAAAAAAGAGAAADADAGGSGPGLRPRQSDHGYGAMYFPWLWVRDPLSEAGERVAVPPSGHMAGVWARSDATRGVHKAPANETIRGALDVTYRVTRADQASLNPAGINCIRWFPSEGLRVWGARTLAPAASEWRYLPVRRLFNMLEESIGRGTRWVVFEPNDRPLWKDIRRDVSAFLRTLWREGALMGRTEEEAFFVRCDEETNPPESIDQGRVIAVIGVAPVKPAEFVIFRIGQHAGGVEIER